MWSLGGAFGKGWAFKELGSMGGLRSFGCTLEKSVGILTPPHSLLLNHELPPWFTVPHRPRTTGLRDHRLGISNLSHNNSFLYQVAIVGICYKDRKLKNIRTEAKHCLTDRTSSFRESFLKQDTMRYILVCQLLFLTQSTRQWCLQRTEQK